jgi:hypothetical protein
MCRHDHLEKPKVYRMRGWNMIEKVIYRIEIPTEDMVEGLPTKLNRFLNELGYDAEIIDSEGFEE